MDIAYSGFQNKTEKKWKKTISGEMPNSGKNRHWAKWKLEGDLRERGLNGIFRGRQMDASCEGLELVEKTFDGKTEREAKERLIYSRTGNTRIRSPLFQERSSTG